jgi:hypothetical protein
MEQAALSAAGLGLFIQHSTLNIQHCLSVRRSEPFRFTMTAHG